MVTCLLYNVYYMLPPLKYRMGVSETMSEIQIQFSHKTIQTLSFP